MLTRSMNRLLNLALLGIVVVGGFLMLVLPVVLGGR